MHTAIQLLCVKVFFLFLPFAKMNWYNKKVNMIASSSFAVYIVQTTYPVLGYLCRWDSFALKNYHYSMYLLLMFITVFIVFGGAFYMTSSERKSLILLLMKRAF